MNTEPRTTITIPIQVDEEFLDFLRSRMTDDGMTLMTDLAEKDVRLYSVADIVLTFNNARIVKGLHFGEGFQEKILDSEVIKDRLRVSKSA